MSQSADSAPPVASLRSLVRQWFRHVLEQASVEKAFTRHIECERGVMRVGDDLYDLNSYGRVFVVSIGKAAHTLVEALEHRAGSRFEGIIASSTRLHRNFAVSVTSKAATRLLMQIRSALQKRC
jgi:glycerate-2-kinase